jgi:hypothetical protein
MLGIAAAYDSFIRTSVFYSHISNCVYPIPAIYDCDLGIFLYPHTSNGIGILQEYSEVYYIKTVKVSIFEYSKYYTCNAILKNTSQKMQYH